MFKTKELQDLYEQFNMVLYQEFNHENKAELLDH